MLDFSEATNVEKKEHYYASVTRVSREFLFLIEVLKMFHPPYKSKSHWHWFREPPIQNKQKRTVSPLWLYLSNTKLTISLKHDQSILEQVKPLLVLQTQKMKTEQIFYFSNSVRSSVHFP